ncbi:MAG: hypothetical protein EBS41_08335, partial [Actinobacteria bacterium]|nr:hypothetical protein [Actinomycetota bacterium]
MPVEQDRRFGQMWEEAESRMLGRLVGSAIRRREIPLAEYLPESAAIPEPRPEEVQLIEGHVLETARQRT